MLASVYTSGLQGFGSYSVNIEAEVRNTKEVQFSIIGLGDSAVKEARDRIQAAVKHSGLKPPHSVLVNLAPAEIKKEGSSFDLGIAVAILLASRQITLPQLNSQTAFYGELSLTGSVKPVNGIISLLLEALSQGVKVVILPEANLNEAVLVKGLQYVPVKHLTDVLNFIKTGIVPSGEYQSSVITQIRCKDFSDVVGQSTIKRALAIAAAGGHNLLMIGPPGCGKSMLAERFVSILPKLSEQEVLETVKIHSLMRQSFNSLLAGVRPFRSPHHGVSEAGLIGGGSPPRPGEISLAHRGVLFLDEFPEFRRTAIEAMRAPMESGLVRVTRARGSYEFPARFQLLAAMNPCPCGRLGVEGKACLCQLNAIQNYLKRLSQPILDRIDLHLDLKPVPLNEITTSPTTLMQKEHERLTQQVLAAKELATQRGLPNNAYLNNRQIEKIMHADPKTQATIKLLAEKQKLSARSYFRFLKLARTIADLEQSEEVHSSHVAEALTYRSLDLIANYCNR